MRYFFSIIFLLFVSGCGHTLLSQDPYNRPTESWQGKTLSQVEQALGNCSIHRQEGPNTLRCWQKNACLLLFYFNSANQVEYVETEGDCHGNK